MVDTTVKEFGRIDYSVNCAGVKSPPYMKVIYHFLMLILT